MKNYIIIIFLAFGFSVQAQSLDLLLQEALSNNSLLKSKDKEYHNFIESSGIDSDVKQTKVAFGYFINRPQTRTGAQVAKLSVSQSFAWFGTALQQERYLMSQSEIVFQDLVLEQKRVIESVSKQYLSLQFNEAFRKDLAKERSLLDQLIEINTESELNNPEVLLELNVEGNSIDQKIYELEIDFERIAAQLNLDLGRGPDDQKIVLSPILQMPEDLVGIDFNWELNPEIKKFDAIQKSLDQSRKLNNYKKAPSISLGLDYVPVAPYEDQHMALSGQDIWMPMLQVNVPIFGGKYREIDKDISRKKEQVELAKVSMEEELEKELLEVLTRRKQLFHRVQTYDDNALLLKQLLTLKSENLYLDPKGISKFINLQSRYLETIQLKHKAMLDFYMIELDLAYLTGN
ncbi:MAG: TolC family protein [Flavobacteriaceae bacterium]